MSIYKSKQRYTAYASLLCKELKQYVIIQVTPTRLSMIEIQLKTIDKDSIYHSTHNYIGGEVWSTLVDWEDRNPELVLEPLLHKKIWTVHWQ